MHYGGSAKEADSDLAKHSAIIICFRQTTTTSSDSETSESESSNSTEQVIEDGIVDLDQADLIIPCAVQQEIIEDDVSENGVHEFVVQKSKRKSQHQLKHVESKR